LRPAVVDFVKFAMQAGNLDLAMEQIVVKTASALVGKSLVASNLRQRFGVIVVGIQRAGGKMEFNPSPEADIQAGDQLVVLGRPESLRELGMAAAPGERAS
jgi:voltage-gated potassium channel